MLKGSPLRSCALAAGFLSLAALSHSKELLKLGDAQKLLFPAAVQFEPRFVLLTPALKEKIEAASDTCVRGEEQKVWKAQGPKGAPLGYFIVDNVIGKHEAFNYAAALSPEGSVLRVEILDYSETHGGQVQRREWLKQFEGKHFGDRVELTHGIDGISGATLSCKHLTDGVRRLLAFYQLALKPAPEAGK